MFGQKLHSAALSKLWQFLTIYKLYSTFGLQITKMKSIFKNAAHNHIALIQREIHNKRFLAFPFQSDDINKFEGRIENFDGISLILQNIIILVFLHVDDFLYEVLTVQIIYFIDAVLIGNFWVGWRYNFIFLICSVLIFRFFHHSDVLDDVLCEFWPL